MLKIAICINIMTLASQNHNVNNEYVVHYKIVFHLKPSVYALVFHESFKMPVLRSGKLTDLFGIT